MIADDVACTEPRKLAPIATYKTLDVWRAIAAILVVFRHIGGTYYTDHYLYKPATPSLRTAFWTVIGCGGAGIWIFFVISGFCICHAACRCIARGTGTSVFLNARLRRIYPTYIAAFFLNLAVMSTAYYMVDHHLIRHSTTVSHGALNLSPYNLAANLTLGYHLFPGSDALLVVSWTLAYEIAFYVVTGAAIWGVKSELGLLYRLHAITLVCICCDLVFPGHTPYPFDLWPAFGMGVVVYHMIRDKSNVGAVRLGLYMLMAQALLILRSESLLSHTIYGDNALLIILFSGCLVVLHPYDRALMQQKALKWLAFIGTFSYSLYLVHLPITAATTALLKRVLPGHYIPVMFLVDIPLAVFFSWLFFVLVERHFLSAGAQNRMVEERAVTPGESSGEAQKATAQSSQVQ